MNINDIEITEEEHKMYMDMKLNAFISTDFDFDSDIGFIVEEYCGDSIPILHKYNDLKSALIYAYILQQKEKLHAFCIMDNKGNETATDVLNYFKDTVYYKKYMEVEEINKEQEEELKMYRDFIDSDEFLKNIFKEYKKEMSKIDQKI